MDIQGSIVINITTFTNIYILVKSVHMYTHKTMRIWYDYVPHAQGIL